MRNEDAAFCGEMQHSHKPFWAQSRLPVSHTLIRSHYTAAWTTCRAGNQSGLKCEDARFALLLFQSLIYPLSSLLFCLSFSGWSRGKENVSGGQNEGELLKCSGLYLMTWCGVLQHQIPASRGPRLGFVDRVKSDVVFPCVKAEKVFRRPVWFVPNQDLIQFSLSI